MTILNDVSILAPDKPGRTTILNDKLAAAVISHILAPITGHQEEPVAVIRHELSAQGGVLVIEGQGTHMVYEADAPGSSTFLIQLVHPCLSGRAQVEGIEASADLLAHAAVYSTLLARVPSTWPVVFSVDIGACGSFAMSATPVISEVEHHA